jgi:Family of unknown function (DUF6200)
MSDTATAKPAASAPIILDLGKKKRSIIKQLCNGEGPLLEEVNDCIDELQTSGTIAAKAQPVVIVVREKRKPKSLLFPGL